MKGPVFAISDKNISKTIATDIQICAIDGHALRTLPLEELGADVLLIDE